MDPKSFSRYDFSFAGIDMLTAPPMEYPEPEPLTWEILQECMALMEEHVEWNMENPPGSPKNPYIMSPCEFDRIKRYQEETGVKLFDFDDVKGKQNQ